MSALVGRLVLVGGLYVAQGMTFGFGAMVLLPRLAAGGVSLEAQGGVLALGGIPWVLKLLWASVLDRRHGPGRRADRVAGVATLAMAACVAGLAMVPDLLHSVGWLAGLWFALNVVTALQDVAVDTFVLDHVPPDKRGLANAAMLGGHHIGNEGLGAMGLGALAVAWGLRAALVTLAVVLVLGGVAALGRGAHERPTQRAFGVSRMEQLKALLARRRTWMLGLFAAVVMSADVLTGTLVWDFLTVRLHWPVERFSLELPLVALSASVVGYLLATRVVQRRGPRLATIVGCAGLGVLWAGFGALPFAWPHLTFMYVFIAAQGVVTALLYVGLHTWLMGQVEPAFRATHYAALMALLNMPRAVMPVVAAPVLAVLGYPALFVVAGAVQIGLALTFAALAARMSTPAT